MTGHLEYKADTLDGEYRRDQAKGLPIAPPLHYYVEDNPEKGIDFSWQQTALLFYRNWVVTHLGSSTSKDFPYSGANQRVAFGKARKNE